MEPKIASSIAQSIWLRELIKLKLTWEDPSNKWGEKLFSDKQRADP
jgi:hypothetical protein